MHIAQPAYACAILRDDHGRFLLEQRDRDRRTAPGRLTCFGGGREAHESSLGCLRRELDEELGWQPARLSAAVDLFVAGRWIARFFSARFDAELGALAVEPGRQAVLVAPTSLASAPLSSWHRAVLAAWLCGRRRVCLPAR
ncbi:MAG: NUDIX domain-containing protein [Planctomycetota bacterium]